MQVTAAMSKIDYIQYEPVTLVPLDITLSRIRTRYYPLSLTVRDASTWSGGRRRDMMQFVGSTPIIPVLSRRLMTLYTLDRAFLGMLTLETK